LAYLKRGFSVVITVGGRWRKNVGSGAEGDVVAALLAGLLLIAACEPEQAATAHRSSLQKPLMGRWTLPTLPRPLTTTAGRSEA